MQAERNQELMSGQTISNLVRPARRPYKFKSEEARARCGTAGAANLAAYKATHPAPAFQHGLAALSRGGEIPPGREALVARADRIIERLASEFGGPDNLTAAQCALIEAIRTSLIALQMAQQLLLSRGLLTRRGTPCAVFETVVSFQNTLCRCLAAFRGEKEDEMPEPYALTEEERLAAIRELVGSADADAPLPAWVSTPQEPGLDVEPETIAEILEDSVEEVAAAEEVAGATVN